MIHSSSRNHSFSSDRDLVVGSSHDEWSVEITSQLQGGGGWGVEGHGDGHGETGEPPVVTVYQTLSCFYSKVNRSLSI